MNKKKPTSALKINLHNRIFPNTKKSLDETLKKWREVYSDDFRQTALIEIAILILADAKSVIDIKNIYNKYREKV